MKKLLKGALSLALIAAVGTPQVMVADNDPNDDLSYQLQVKSYNFSKDNANGLKGVAYKNTYSNNPTWPMTDAYTNFEDYQSKYSFVANYKDFYNNVTTNNKACYVKQFGVSMGVVYWIVPTKNVIYYWNTVTNEMGELVPPAATYQGKTYTFEGATTGYGNVTHDWKGNLVHQWNKIGVASPGINTPAQGFAIYKAPSTYGEVISTAPKLSDMTTCDVPYDKAQLKAGSTTQVQMPQVWNRMTVPNPNIPSSACQSLWNQSIGTPVAMDYMGASGDFWGGSDVWAYSAYFQGKASGYLFFSYNNLIFGQMIAEGGYANWYLNYVMKYHHYRTAINASLSTEVNAESLNATYGHSREFYFMETDPLEYFWSVPFTGAYESPGPSAADDIVHEAICVLPHNWDNSLGNQMTDWMSAPEVDSIKGYRVLINSVNLNQYAANTAYRTGSIELNYCEYTGHDYVLKTKEPVSRNYSNLTSFFAYNNTRNGDPLTGHSVNSWNELERVNNNVLALYTHVPGKGFSKYYITAVEENNPVTGLSVKRSSYIDGTKTDNTIDAIVSWTAQKHDRATLHRYEVWYQTFKRDANNNLVTLCDNTWELATVDSNGDPQPVDIGTSTTGTFVHKNIKYGENSDGTTYDIEYKYMVIPIYDASDHRGTEAIATSNVVAKGPVSPITATFKQVTDKNANGETLYGFSLKLDPQVDISKQGANTAAKMLIVPQDDVTKEALADNTGITGPTGVTVTENKNASTYTIYDTNDLSVNGYHVVVDGFTVGSNGDLPLLTWHNVNPEKEYKIKVYIVATSSSYFTPSSVLTTTLYVPEPNWSLPEASFHRLKDDYGELTENEDMPIGSFRRIDPKTDALDENPSNPVTLNKANYYGTNGAAITPLFVTNEVLGTYNAETKVYENNGWKVEYRVDIYDGDTNVKYGVFNDQTTPGGYGEVYSNEANVMCDIVGLKVPYTTTVAEDDRTRKIYDNTPKNYKTKITVTYTRADNANIKVKRETEGVLTTGTTNLPTLGVKSASQSAVLGALYQRGDSHFYYNNNTDEGYYPFYYDAAMLFNWDEYSSLNRYMGYYGKSTFTCYGHYENPEHNPNTWVQYHAGSVLTDAEVESLVSESGIMALNNGSIGYNSTADNWSAQAIENNQVPMNIHYVHGSNTQLFGAEAIAKIKFDVTLTAEYPIVVAGTGDNEFCDLLAAEDPSTYKIIGATRYMDVMTVPTQLTDLYMDQETTVTGVEGILTNACGGWQLYPNPVGSFVTIEAPMLINDVKIFTMDGQLVKVVKGVKDTTVKINVEELPQGVYIVNVLGVAKMMIKL